MYARTFACGEFVNCESRFSQHDADDRHSGSSTPVSGSGSPTSGRATPADSDSGTNDVLPVPYEPVKRVNVVRQRSKPVPTQSSSCKYRSVNLCVCVHVCYSLVTKMHSHAKVATLVTPPNFVSEVNDS